MRTVLSLLLLSCGVLSHAQVQVESAGYLGVRLADISPERASSLKLSEVRGVEVKMVAESSPADKAGIQPGDVLLSYNGEAILGAEQLSRMVRETPPGRKVKVECWRNGKTFGTVITVGAGNGSAMNGFPPVPPFNWPNDIDVPEPFLLWSNATVGIVFERVDSQLANYFGVKGGILVRLVRPGSPAERAGLRAGDVIYSVAQQNLSSERDFFSLIRQHGGSVPLSLMRDHKRIDLTIGLPQ